MKRRNFIASIAAAAAAASCTNPRMDERKPRYDQKECPFCVKNPGTCSYCHGTSKCHFCNGTGTRVTSTENYPWQGVEKVKIEESCSHCEGTGECRYCDATGKCWPCEGTGKIDSWDFHKKYKKEKKTK